MKKADEMSHEELARALVAMPKRGRGRPKKPALNEIGAAQVRFDAPPIPTGHLYTAAGVTELTTHSVPRPDDTVLQKSVESAAKEFMAEALVKQGFDGLPAFSAIRGNHGPLKDPSQAEVERWANEVPGIELPMPGELPDAGIPITATEPYAYPEFNPVLDDLPAGVRWATVIREPHNRNMKLVRFLDDGSEDIAWIRSRDLDKLGGRMEGTRIKLVVNPDAFQGGWIQWRG
jgi:hypothetical protein